MGDWSNLGSKLGAGVGGHCPHRITINCNFAKHWHTTIRVGLAQRMTESRWSSSSESFLARRTRAAPLVAPEEGAR